MTVHLGGSRVCLDKKVHCSMQNGIKRVHLSHNGHGDWCCNDERSLGGYSNGRCQLSIYSVLDKCGTLLCGNRCGGGC